MHSIQLERMFSEIKFHKRGSEIAEKSQRKIEKLKAKIAEREARIARTCEEHHLSPSDLFALAQDQRENENRRGSAYTAPVRDVAAGVASALARESQQVESERAQVRTLGLLTRNVETTESHELSFAELEYLEF